MGAVVEAHSDRPAVWRLAWLTPLRCRLILAIVLGAGFASHLHYLLADCPVDLSGDEAYYWDWSRKLDLCYYSKGPMIAYLIRASCAVFGDTMPAVRLPALVLAVGTSLLTYWLTSKLFGSEKLALGAVLLNHLVPMFIAGSILMTIDPPLYFLWSVATACAAKAVFDGSRWAWVGMGIAVGLGFLTKFSMPLWLAGLGLFLAIDADGRKQLKTRWPWIMLVIVAVFSVPIIIFNLQHGAVTVKHVGGDVGGTEKSGLSLLGPLEFLATQFGMLGPALFVVMTWAVVYAVGRVRFSARRNGSTCAEAHPTQHGSDPHARALRLLLCIGLSFFAFVLISSTFTKAQGNWAAPAYFTLMILSAYFLSTRLRQPQLWRPWRMWLWAAVAIGGLMMVLIHNMELLYRPVNWVGRKITKKDVPPRSWDVSFRLRGWRDLGTYVSEQMATLHDPFIIAEKYEFTAELAFYVKGQPKALCMGSWFADPERRWRMSQYDLWPDRRLDRPELLGRDHVVGYGLDKEHAQEPPAELKNAFRSVEPVQHFDVAREGIVIRTFHVWICRGMQRPIDWPGAQEKH